MWYIMLLLHKGLKTLAVETIDLIKEDGDDKLSSTDLRRRQLGEHRVVEVTIHTTVY